MPSLRVEVVYARAEAQEVVALKLPEGSSAAQAVAASGLAAGACPLGIGGRRIAPGRALRDGDRVEILRPLAADPNEARRRRAQKKKRRA
jgi:putative ubiquitin-RnfH superfamily antitoxin RatB of RatAB toxin-antitoxin module